MTDDALLIEIGYRIARIRLERNMTQEQLAQEAGLGLRTVQRLEKGESATQLSGFIRVSRVLGLLENFDRMIPEPSVSPMAQLKLQGRRRKRASGQEPKKPQKGKWTWGDES